MSVLSNLDRAGHVPRHSRRGCDSFRPWNNACCYTCIVLVYPVLPIGAEILRGERMPGTEDGPARSFAGAAIGAGDGRYRRPAGAGLLTWRRRARALEAVEKVVTANVCCWQRRRRAIATPAQGQCYADEHQRRDVLTED